jgi:Cd2+/Zn2+-exporting ATPase
MLSGDKQALVTKVAGQLKMTGGYGDLLPEGKVAHISALQQQGRKVAFIGDGINDAPVIALSDVGLAMGALGSDMAIETADVVIQDDRPSKVAEAIHIGRRTHHIVYENIVLAIGIKVLVMILGLFGVANLWEAVFADSGVALLAVINATRIFFDREYKYSARVVNILQDKEQLEHFKESGSDFHEQVNL